MPRVADPATGYRCLMPGGWAYLDGREHLRATSVRRAVRQRVRRDPRLAPHIAHLDRLLTHECAVAAARGALWVGLLAEPAGERVLTAAATFTVAHRPDGPHGTEPTAAELMDQVAPEHARVAHGDPSAYLRVVPTAQQDALARHWRQSGPYGRESEVTHHLWQLLLPWPGRPAAGLLTYATPCEPLRAGIEELFGVAGETFRWTWDHPPPGDASD